MSAWCYISCSQKPSKTKTYFVMGVKVTPAISGSGVGWKTEKMVTSRKPFVIVIAVVTAVNGTLFPSFLRSRRRSILVGITAVHYRKVSQKNRTKGKKKQR